MDIEVDVAKDKNGFMNRVKRCKYCAILIYNNEGDTNIFSLSKWYRLREQKQKLKFVPILVMTKCATQEFINLCQREGINGSIKIPIQKAKLLRVMEDTFKFKPTINPAMDSNSPKHVMNTKMKLSFKKRNSIPIKEKAKTNVKMKGNCTENAPTFETPFLLQDDVNSRAGQIRFDANTTFTYTVMDSASCSTLNKGKDSIPPPKSMKRTVFNLIVCHDIFDTQERLKILLRPITIRYPGLQILLWNYPGQAYTTFKDGQILNNVFHAKCLNRLIDHVGQNCESSFDSNHPFFLMGFGNGASIALHYAAKFRPSNLRGLLIINGFTFVDPNFASIIHDCRNVFQHSPEARPDLAIYFYSRFIFSSSYLKNTTVPLALNLYTAIHNPLTLKGRIQLCKGALNHVDTRPFLQDITPPILLVHSKQDKFVKISHTKFFADGKSRSSCRNINQLLRGGSSKTMIFIIEGGHEVFQEHKNDILDLIEQIITGFHEINDLPINLSFIHGKEATEKHIGISKNKGCNQIKKESLDQYIDTVIKVRKRDKKSKSRGEEKVICKEENKVDESILGTETFNEYRSSLTEEMNEKNKHLYFKLTHARVPNESKKQDNEQTLFNHMITKTSNQNEAYNVGSKSPHTYQIKEYMSWRQKRNQKRLSRLHNATKIIQRAFRVYMAKTLVIRLKFLSSTIMIQRCFRGKIGRDVFSQMRKELWAAKFTQRTIRGHLGRLKYCQRRKKVEAQLLVSRQWRGFRQRKLVRRLVERRECGAIKFQCIWRKYFSKKIMIRKRNENNASMEVQRIYRGYMGRCKSEKEREKYIFGRSRSIGIELGRQMLTEHKLNATKLQSEISILNKEKKILMGEVDSNLEEIKKIEKGVTSLETEMHKLNKLEQDNGAQVIGNINYELREQKS